jgi:hypothetical protein
MYIVIDASKMCNPRPELIESARRKRELPEQQDAVQMGDHEP